MPQEDATQSSQTKPQTKNPLEFILRVEQFVEQAQGQQSSQALVLSNIARDGQAIDVDVTQAQATLTRLVEADDEALGLRANSYVRVTVERITREEAEASFNRPQVQPAQQQWSSAPLTPNTAQATQAPVRAVEPQQSSVVSAAPAQQQ